jgi:hypothetical protein
MQWTNPKTLTELSTAFGEPEEVKKPPVGLVGSDEKLSCLRVKKGGRWETPGDIYIKKSDGTWGKVDDFYYKLGGTWNNCQSTECAEFLDNFTDIEGIPLENHVSDSGATWENVGRIPIDITTSSKSPGTVAGVSPYSGVGANACAEEVIGIGCAVAKSNFQLNSPDVDVSFRLIGFETTPVKLALFWDGENIETINNSSYYYSGVSCSSNDGIFISTTYQFADGPSYAVLTLTQILGGNVVSKKDFQIYIGSGSSVVIDYVDVEMSFNGLTIDLKIEFEGYFFEFDSVWHVYPYKQNKNLGIIMALDQYSNVRGVDNLSITCR